jgi:membrane-associated phospholipid phosphatase
MIDAIRVDNSGPTVSTRNLAILHTAIYDAVNSVVRSHQSYRSLPTLPGETSAEAAAVGAAHLITISLYPGIAARAEELLSRYLATAVPAVALTNGLALGNEVARTALNLRENDGANTEVPYIPGTDPGDWRRTPPFFRPPVTPHWRYVIPFGVDEVARFVPPPPPALESPEYAAAVQEVQAIGGKTSTVRTAYQTQTAVFWSDFSYTSMPPGHWHLITAEIVRTHSHSLHETSRLFALLSIAQADSAIVSWEAKYRYNLWRPVTAIQRADEDGNPLTDADPAWDHLLGAPPFPSYTSGHSTFSTASAEVLKHFYGTDSITFTATSDSVPGVTRTYSSFSDCADEIGLSRIYGGIHFSFDNLAGKVSGRKIGAFVSRNYLLPLEKLPSLVLESSAGGQSRIRVHAAIGTTAQLEASANLQDWQPVFTSFAAQPGGVVISDPSASPHRFYRVRSLSSQ